MCLGRSPYSMEPIILEKNKLNSSATRRVVVTDDFNVKLYLSVFLQVLMIVAAHVQPV